MAGSSVPEPNSGLLFLAVLDFNALFGDLFENEAQVAASDERVLYMARDKLLKRRVALRVQLKDGDGREWFLRETEVLAGLDHPSIRHVYSAGLQGGYMYRVGNWIAGESLADAVARGPRPIPQVLSLGRDLLYALDHAHVRGITLRRITPSTLMLDTSSRAVVTDLRYANQVLASITAARQPDDSPFLAPEVRGGERGDPGADIWAAGALLYYALTGKPPEGKIPRVSELRPECPTTIEAWVMRALERKQKDRFPTAAEMLADLANFADPFTEPGAAGPVAILPDSPMWERRLRRALGDDYALIADIGQGSFGTVYRVRDLHLEREVAMKVLDPRLTQDPAIAESFQREAQLAASLRHPNIVSIYDIDGRMGLLWYTMEWIRGQNVAQLVDRRGRLSVVETIEIIDDTLSALEYAHARRIVHRDIKPENLLVDRESRIHVTDFGLAVALPRGRLFGGATSRSGTPHFAAPEQLAGGQVDQRTDLFSLSAVALYLLLGRPPFKERGLEQWSGDVRVTVPDVGAERDDVPPALAEVFMKGCSYEPGDRYQNGTAFREAIEAAGFVTGERPLPSSPGLLARIRSLF